MPRRTNEPGKPIRTNAVRRATLDDIASACGLSKQTVSHVLGTRAHLFTPATVELVRRTASTLGWRRNRAAQVVATGRQGQIAVLTSTLARRSHLAGDLLAGLHDAASAHDLLLVLARIDDARLDDPIFVPDILAHLACDGLVVKYDCSPPPRLGALVDKHVLPAVWVNQHREHDSVRPDDAGGVGLGLEVLSGRRRTGFADLAARLPPGSPDEHYSRDERSGAFSCLRPQSPTLLAAAADPVAQTSAWLAEHRLDGVICSNDITAQIVINAAERLGQEIPRDLAVITFGNDSTHAAGRRLAVLDHPEQEMGRQAVEMLIERISEPARHLPGRILPFTFIPGFGC